MFGLPKMLREAPRDKTVCQFTIKEEGVIEIRDLTEDKRTAKLDSVIPENGLRYYLGIPLMTKNNYAIGTLCVLDFEKKTLTDKQIRQLKIIAKDVMTHIVLHKQNIELERLNDYKVQLMKMLSHDMRSPLNGIIGLSSMLREQMENEQSAHIEVIDIIELFNNRVG